MTQNSPGRGAQSGRATEEHDGPTRTANAFVSDMCETFDYRLVGDILNQAYDKDLMNCRRPGSARGCQNRVQPGNGRLKDGKAPARPKTAADIDARSRRHRGQIQL